jgi:hypothetical protein
MRQIDATNSLYEPNYENYEAESALDFIEWIRLSHSRWDWPSEPMDRILGVEGRWYFRGQANSEWKLIPSAWRFAIEGEKKSLNEILLENVKNAVSFIDNTFGGYKDGIGKPTSEQSRLRFTVLQIVAELAIVKEFITFADRIGITVPTTHIPTLDWNTVDRIGVDLRFGENEPLLYRTIWSDPAIALAQHHQIPTRLLDWTFNPLVAAYFAVAEAIENQNQNGHIALYALHSSYCKQDHIEVVSVKRTENTYLGAQDGVFIVNRGARLKHSSQPDVWYGADRFYMRHGYYPDLMSSLKHHESPTSCPPPRRILLRISQGAELLRLLKQEQISRAHLMPTLDNVAQTVKESWHLY